MFSHLWTQGYSHGLGCSFLQWLWVATGIMFNVRISSWLPRPIKKKRICIYYSFGCVSLSCGTGEFMLCHVGSLLRVSCPVAYVILVFQPGVEPQVPGTARADSQPLDYKGSPMFVCFYFNWGILDILYYISFRCKYKTLIFDTCIYCDHHKSSKHPSPYSYNFSLLWWELLRVLYATQYY